MISATLIFFSFYGVLGVFGILGELCWITDDYTRDLPPSFQQSPSPSDVKRYVHARRLQEQSERAAR